MPTTVEKLGHLARGLSRGLARDARRSLTGSAELAPVDVFGHDAPVLPAGATVRLLSWNIQFAGSRRHRFWYDGGRAVHVPAVDVQATLRAIREVLMDVRPDVALWQEVDRGADRTAGIDELPPLLAGAGHRAFATAAYHELPWVPHPPHQPLGRVSMHLAISSRYRLDHAVRIGLAPLHEPWWRRAFNVRRCVLHATLPVSDGGHLHLLDTHLSAFSGGDGTLERQVRVIHDRVAGLDAQHGRWLLAGDFNALPPGDDAARLGRDASEYPEPVTPILPLTPWLTVPPERYPTWRTYLPPEADVPDRALDYVFAGRSVEVLDVQALAVHDVSDHLPVLVTFRVPERPCSTTS